MFSMHFFFISNYYLLFVIVSYLFYTIVLHCNGRIAVPTMSTSVCTISSCTITTTSGKNVRISFYQDKRQETVSSTHLLHTHNIYVFSTHFNVPMEPCNENMNCVKLVDQIFNVNLRVSLLTVEV